MTSATNSSPTTPHPPHGNAGGVGPHPPPTTTLPTGSTAGPAPEATTERTDPATTNAGSLRSSQDKEGAGLTGDTTETSVREDLVRREKRGRKGKRVGGRWREHPGGGLIGTGGGGAALAEVITSVKGRTLLAIVVVIIAREGDHTLVPSLRADAPAVRRTAGVVGVATGGGVAAVGKWV